MDQPESSGKVAAAKKQPPPESDGHILTRRSVIAAFWVVALLFGLPLWWKTTSVYRAELPLQSMLDWADGKTCRPVFPLRIAIDAPSVPPQDASNLLKITQHALDDSNEFSAHHLRLVQSETGGASSNEEKGELDQTDEGVALNIKLIQGNGGATPRAEMLPYSPTLNVYYTPNQLPSSSSTSSPLATFIANELQNIYAEEQATLAHLLAQHSGTQPAKIKSLTQELSQSLARQTTRSFKYAPTYHLTFSLFTPTSTPSAWDIESALQEYIEPLVSSFSRISNFTIDTQVQLYATFAPSIQQPEYDQELKAWTLRKDDLSGFINAAEWPLSPSIGTGPTVNFILYVPDPSQSPLVVKENRGTSWLIPQWGGIAIFHPPNAGKSGSVPPSLRKEDLAPSLLTFSNQLTSLLGLPQTPASLPLRLAALERVRAASLLLSASNTLGSLARLTQALPSIAIPDAVATSVDETISRLHASCNNFREGQFPEALVDARVAEQEAEKAFFERSMVGQVYFPDEHKVAVYLPLLGPVSVPLLMAGLKEVKKLVRRER